MQASSMPMRRVMIIGGPGSGKSTAARLLGEATGLPVIHIDKLYWKPGWVLRDPDETRALIAEAVQGCEWVFDGNFSSTFSERAARADTIIFLDIGTVRRLYRVFWRTLSGRSRSRPDMADGCPERFDYAFTKFVIGYGFRANGGRAKALELLASNTDHVRTYHFRSTAALNRFVKSCVGGAAD